MKIRNLSICLLTIASLFGVASCSNQGSNNKVEEKVLNKLGEIVAPKTTLHAKEEIKLSTEATNITWSVSNDLASIDQEGNLKVGDKDGQFIVTITSKDHPEFSANKLFTVQTISPEGLAKMLYQSAQGQNYTLTWTGKFFDEKGNEVTIDQAKEDGQDASVGPIFEDMTTKGNVIKYTNDAFYWKYGVDGYGNSYEGGSYNSPDGYVYDYNVENGKTVKGNVDYFSAYTNTPHYQELYTNDLRYFVRDEFKVLDANLKLSDDGTSLIYNANDDSNDFKNASTSLSTDWSLSSTLFMIVDSFYSEQFVDYRYDIDATGTITYDDQGMVSKFLYKNVSIAETACYNYEATFTLSDIGTTEIAGIPELIKADQAALDQKE